MEQRFFAGRPDPVLLNIGMPKHNGYNAGHVPYSEPWDVNSRTRSMPTGVKEQTGKPLPRLA
ncbi:MAG: hypothetical protein WAU70_06675 [Flavobacteriales bacterium]